MDKINKTKNQQILMREELNTLDNSTNIVWSDILNEEKFGTLLSHIKIFGSYKKKYEELHQKLKEVIDITKNLLPSSALKVPVNELKFCKIDDYINTQIRTIEENHFLEESEFIKSHLKIDPVLTRKRKRTSDDANLDSATGRRMESYKRSRLHEKVRRMTRDLREDFINKKLNESNSVLNKISKLVIKQNKEIISPAIVVNEAIFGCV